MKKNSSIGLEMLPPHPDTYIRTEQLAELTCMTQRFWEARRISGDTPPYVCISKRCVLYKWGDVLEWLEKRKINNTAQSTVQK
jgi:predicted DNA-binding transcriptional regulator AlpA